MSTFFSLHFFVTQLKRKKSMTGKGRRSTKRESHSSYYDHYCMSLFGLVSWYEIVVNCSHVKTTLKSRNVSHYMNNDSLIYFSNSLYILPLTVSCNSVSSWEKLTLYLAVSIVINFKFPVFQSRTQESLLKAREVWRTRAPVCSR